MLLTAACNQLDVDVHLRGLSRTAHLPMVSEVDMRATVFLLMFS